MAPCPGVPSAGGDGGRSRTGPFQDPDGECLPERKPSGQKPYERRFTSVGSSTVNGRCSAGDAEDLMLGT